MVMRVRGWQWTSEPSDGDIGHVGADADAIGGGGDAAWMEGSGWQHTRTRPVNPLQQPLSLGPDAAERQDRETWACFRQPPTHLDLMQADNRRTGVSGQDGIQQGGPLFIIILRRGASASKNWL